MDKRKRTKGQTTQWPKEKVQKEKQRSTNIHIQTRRLYIKQKRKGLYI
jgi:hypothetical protein